jgi:colanic acid/amylovoran biosynthesis glycosyltransferase
LDNGSRDGRLGYLCSHYPGISHTFVHREVLALRQRAIEVSTFAIHRASPEHLLSRGDREAFETTFAVLPPRWPRLIWAHARLALTAPRAYLSTLRVALRLPSTGMKGRLWLFFYFVEAVVLWDQCRRQGVRHLHVHLANVSADVALLVAELGNAVDGPAGGWSWSFTMHGPTELFDVTRFRLPEKVARAKFVVCISDFTRSQLMALSDPADWKKLHVVHCSVDAESFRPRGDHKGGEDHEILCIGRLVPEKGHALLLEAIATLRRRGYSVRATLAGGGPTRDALERLAAELGVAEHVAFPGPVGQDEIRDYYASATVFCLPSFAEGVPGVIMEAMAMELPVVTSLITGIPELVEHERTGYLVTPGRSDELADALERLLEDSERRAAMGRAGRVKVMRDFNPEDLGANLQRLFLAHGALPSSGSLPADGSRLYDGSLARGGLAR